VDRSHQRAPFCATSPTAEAMRSDRIRSEFKSPVAYQSHGRLDQLAESNRSKRFAVGVRVLGRQPLHARLAQRKRDDPSGKGHGLLNRRESFGGSSPPPSSKSFWRNGRRAGLTGWCREASGFASPKGHQCSVTLLVWRSGCQPAERRSKLLPSANSGCSSVGRVPVSETRGRWIVSSHPDHFARLAKWEGRPLIMV
jgi:hypothetical protein